VDERTLEWLQLLARALIWGAVLVLALSVIGAIQIATSESGTGIFTDFEQQSRGIAAVGALGAGVSAAGILAGLGAILLVLLAGREPDGTARGGGTTGPDA
jgi:hypothetical protein